MSDGIVCRRCMGRIDEGAYEQKRRLCARLRKPYTAPKLCSDCWLLAIFEMTDEVEEKPKPAWQVKGCSCGARIGQPCVAASSHSRSDKACDKCGALCCRPGEALCPSCQDTPIFSEKWTSTDRLRLALVLAAQVRNDIALDRYGAPLEMGDGAMPTKFRPNCTSIQGVLTVPAAELEDMRSDAEKIVTDFFGADKGALSEYLGRDFTLYNVVRGMSLLNWNKLEQLRRRLRVFVRGCFRDDEAAEKFLQRARDNDRREGT